MEAFPEGFQTVPYPAHPNSTQSSPTIIIPKSTFSYTNKTSSSFGRHSREISNELSLPKSDLLKATYIFEFRVFIRKWLFHAHVGDIA